MDASVRDIRYRKGFEPVAIEVVTPFGKMTFQTNQATLTARAGGGNWGDDEADALAQDTLNQLYPDSGFVIV